MILIQPILVALFAAFVVFYFRRLRSKLWDRIIVVSSLGIATLFVIHPPLATRLALLTGVGRGADLLFYISIPSLAFALLLLFSRIRELEQRSTVMVRELALLRAKSPDQPRP